MNIFTLNTNSQVTIVGLLFEYSDSATFNSGNNLRLLSIQDAIFRHSIVNTQSLIIGNGLASLDSKAEFIFKNCTFENISVSHSLLHVKNGPIVTYDTVSMNNLRKVEAFSESDLQFQAQWAGGVCALTTTDVSFIVKKSNFTNIYGHCFGLQLTAIIMEDSIFDNTDIEETPITISVITLSALTINSGTTWINIDDVGTVSTSGYQAIFKRNIFKTNKRMALYGGVIIHDYLIVNQVIRQLDILELI